MNLPALGILVVMAIVILGFYKLTQDLVHSKADSIQELRDQYRQQQAEPSESENDVTTQAVSKSDVLETIRSEMKTQLAPTRDALFSAVSGLERTKQALNTHLTTLPTSIHQALTATLQRYRQVPGRLKHLSTQITNLVNNMGDVSELVLKTALYKLKKEKLKQEKEEEVAVTTEVVEDVNVTVEPSYLHDPSDIAVRAEEGGYVVDLVSSETGKLHSRQSLREYMRTIF